VERFLPGGDCAKFEDCESGQIARKLKILLQMSLVPLHGPVPVVRVGRLPIRWAASTDTETRDGVIALPRDPVNRPGLRLPNATCPELPAWLRARGPDAEFRAALIDGDSLTCHRNIGTWLRRIAVARPVPAIATSIAVPDHRGHSGSRV
jgi:hypothetical protein